MSDSQPRLALVVAMDREGAIGRGGALPWQLPDDLRHFRQITMGLPILMGRKTFESIGRPLPGRRNLVMSNQAGWQVAGTERVGSLAEALQRTAGSEWLMVIGGAQLYALTLDRAETLHLCVVDTVVDGADTWFPAWDRHHWTLQNRRFHPADERHAHAFEQQRLVRQPSPV